MAKQVERKKNWAVYILFALAVIAGILAFIDAGRYMGWIPINASVPGLGEISFVYPSAQWFAALMAALLGAIWFMVAWWLWTLNPSGWLFVVVISVINLIFLFLAILGKTTFTQVLPAMLVNALALILALLPGTKQAFIPPLPSKDQIRSAKATAAASAATAATAAPMAEARPAPVSQDLTAVEGVGPKIATALKAAGINNYADLAAASPEQLRKILNAAGLSADPATWPEQARLAAAGKTAELKAYQEKLQGGRAAQ
jgi:predicted flap endonuclease-1-like 5' DNA nuclease